jgi:predicted methyltransferase
MRTLGRGRFARIWLSMGIAGLMACGVAAFATAPVQAQDYRALLAAPDRTAADRENDKRRDPTDMLTFIQPRPGMKILDMGAGAGYSTELMARAAGPTGMVWGQNPPDQFEGARRAFDERAKSAAMKSAAQDVRPFDDPVPPGVRDLDLVTFLFFYHDTTYLPVDRALMNKRLFDALKPGGILAIADYSARPGDGVTAGRSLHRIDEETVKREVEAAGFKLVGEGDFLRHPEDKRDTLSSRATMPVDEFILKFEKPR